MRTIDNIRVLERSDIERQAPSFYATQPKSNVSERYAFISTEVIARTLWGLGWMPTKVEEMRANITENRGFQKHMIRFSHPDFSNREERIELVGVNSHNRACPFEFMAGVFRLVCSNGMIAQTGDFGSFKIRHIGDISDQVQRGVERIAVESKVIATKMNEYKNIQLSGEEQLLYAGIVNSYVNGDAPPITNQKLLTTRRGVDRERNDLWTTYNVVQENIMKGGLRGYNSKNRRMKTRAIKSIDKNIALNKALWTLTEKMAELKS